MWSIARDFAEEITHARPAEAATATIARSIAIKNSSTHPDPDHIEPGDCLALPAPSFVTLEMQSPLA